MQRIRPAAWAAASLSIVALIALAATLAPQPAVGQPGAGQPGAGGRAGPPGRPADAPPSTPPWQAASPWPDRIVVTLAGEPTASFSVSWRTAGSVDSARAEIVEAGIQSRFDLGARSVDATTQSPSLTEKRVGDTTYPLGWNDHLAPVSYHSATFAGLEPDTLYAYRVMGAEDHWSEWMQTRTAPAGDAPFRFLYFGDAQDGILSHWARVVRTAYATAPDARFAIHAGDLVNIASRDFEWAEWFRSVGFIHGMIPALPVVGNHEYFDGIRGDSGPITALSVLWRPQFTLPEPAGLPDELRETVYAVPYGDAVIAVLDTMADAHFELQARWLDGVLAASDARWKIVTMHHPVFELLERRNIPGLPDTGPERRAAFLPVLERHGVDIVLQGHDHSYGRGRVAGPSRRDSAGTVFVTSSSGAKMYATDPAGWDRFGEAGAVLDRRAENTQFFQIVSIDGETLEYEARTATGRVYDAFRIEKPRPGDSRIVELPTDFDGELRFDNTGVYEDPRLDSVPPLPDP